jgi:hypothetical protein
MWQFLMISFFLMPYTWKVSNKNSPQATVLRLDAKIVSFVFMVCYQDISVYI